MNSRLAVLLNDPISPLLEKGEATENYYNPGNVFDEVHIVLCNDDRPDIARLKPMAGTAQLFLHNLPTPSRFFFRTLGWRESLMSDWLLSAAKLVEKIKPHLIRCYGAHINATAARVFQNVAKAPLLLSLHSRPDVCPSGLSFLEQMRHKALCRLAERELKLADMVLAVYRSQLPYLDRLGVKSVELAYNVLNPSGISIKDDYRVGEEIKVLSVGRLIPGKNPENLIRAVAEFKNVSLTIVGDGPLRDYLNSLSYELGMSKQVNFVPAMDNNLLCQSFREYDVFAAHNDYPGVPKAIMEPLLSGLPMLINECAGEVIPELTEQICLFVENSKTGYRSGLEKMLHDVSFREKIGRSAREYAQELWDPAKTEARYVDIYRRVMGENYCAYNLKLH